MRRALLNMTAALLLGLTAATAAQAMTPTETVKSRVDQALQSLGQSSAATPEAAERRRAEIRRAADSLFDFSEMSRRALGRHWADRTPTERDEFVRLFTDLMARSYIGKIDRYAGRPSRTPASAWTVTRPASGRRSSPPRGRRSRWSTGCTV